MSYLKGADVGSYQSDQLSYFKKLKNNGVDFTVVKLTEATTYVNPKAGKQITNSFKAGMKAVSVYHYFHGNGAAEAKYFLNWVKKFGMDKNTVLAIDVEDSSLPWNTTPQVNIFLKALKAAGYKNVITYGSASWFNSNRINRSKLIDKHIWVASYGSANAGVAKANAWQYTDNFQGLNTDCSYDFDGSLSGITKKSKSKPSYNNKKGLYEVKASLVNAYNDNHFKSKRRVRLIKGSTVYAEPVKYGKIYRLKTKIGYFTANKKYMKLIKKIK